MSNRMTLSMALNNLCANYGKFGYGRDLFKQLLLDGISHGLSVKSAYNAIRMSLADYVGEHEYFSVDDVAEMIGVSQEEVISEIEQQREEILKSGGNPDDYFTECKTIAHFISNGL